MVAEPQTVIVSDDAIWQLAGKAAAAVYRRVRDLDYSMSEDDLAMIAAEHLYTNLHKFRPEAASFSTWGYRRAVGAIVDHYRRLTRYRPGPSRLNRYQILIRPAWTDNWVVAHLSRQMAQDDLPDDGPDLTDLDRLRVALHLLPFEQQVILFSNIGMGLNLREIADFMGYSRTWITRLRRRALDTLRDAWTMQLEVVGEWSGDFDDGEATTSANEGR